MGVVIAFIVITFVILPLITKAYNLLIKRPDYVTEQSYERIVYLFKNVNEGKFTVPIQIGEDFKITTNSEDNYCSKDCICLCKEDDISMSGVKKGCGLKIYNIDCFKKETPPMHFHYSYAGVQYINFEINKEIIKSEQGISCEGIEDLNLCTNYKCIIYTGKCKNCFSTFKCEQYSLTLSESTTFGQPEFSFSIDKNEENYELHKRQCLGDPCGFDKEGITCYWEEEQDIGRCIPCSQNIDCSKVPLDICDKVCKGACTLSKEGEIVKCVVKQ